MTWEVVRQAGAVVDGERFILQHTARRKGQGICLPTFTGVN